MLGAHGATKVHATGDLSGAMQGVSVAAALAALVESEPPELIMFGTTYDGRDIAGRLAVKLDKPVITNNTEVEVDGDSIVVSEPIFGGITDRQDEVHRRGSSARRVPAEVLRGRGVGRWPGRSGRTAACPTPAPRGPHGSRIATSRSTAARSSTRRRSSYPEVADSARPASTR